MWAPLVSALTSGFAWLFRNRLGQWLAAALAWMGLAWATNKFAVQPWVDAMHAHLQTSGVGGGEVGAAMIEYLGLLNFFKACSMIASAVTAKFAANAARAFLVKKT